MLEGANRRSVFGRARGTDAGADHRGSTGDERCDRPHGTSRNGSDPSARRRKAGAGLSGGRWIAPLGMVLASIVAMKAVVHANIGPESYDHKIAVLAAGILMSLAGVKALPNFEGPPLLDGRWAGVARERRSRR